MHSQRISERTFVLFADDVAYERRRRLAVAAEQRRVVCLAKVRPRQRLHDSLQQRRHLHHRGHQQQHASNDDVNGDDVRVVSSYHGGDVHRPGRAAEGSDGCGGGRAARRAVGAAVEGRSRGVALQGQAPALRPHPVAGSHDVVDAPPPKHPPARQRRGARVLRPQAHPPHLLPRRAQEGHPQLQQRYTYGDHHRPPAAMALN